MSHDRELHWSVEWWLRAAGKWKMKAKTIKLEWLRKSTDLKRFVVIEMCASQASPETVYALLVCCNELLLAVNGLKLSEFVLWLLWTVDELCSQWRQVMNAIFSSPCTLLSVPRTSVLSSLCWLYDIRVCAICWKSAPSDSSVIQLARLCPAISVAISTALWVFLLL